MIDLQFFNFTLRPDLLARPVFAALEELAALTGDSNCARVAAIDPSFANGDAFCERYDVPRESGANCVVVEGRRGDIIQYAACLAQVGCKLDLNGVVRRALDARRVSLADRDKVLAETSMEYGSVTAVGLPSDWAVFIDPAVAALDSVIIGSGLVRSKLCISGQTLAMIPSAVIIDGLGHSSS